MAFEKFFPTVGSDSDSLLECWIREQLSAIPKGAKLLDAGAGECRYRACGAHLEYNGQDVGQYHGGTGCDEGQNPTFWDNSKLDVVCDIADLPVDDESFDGVLCTEVLEHVPNPLASCKELTRVGRRGGTFRLTVPFVSLTHFSPYHFCTGCSPNFFKHHLPEMGLRIDAVETTGNFYGFLAQEIRRLKRVVRDDNCRTPLLYYPMAFVALWYLQGMAYGKTRSDAFSPYKVMIRATKLT